MRGVYFDWDEEHGGEHGMGMIAEEVGEYVPEVVMYEEDGEYATGRSFQTWSLRDQGLLEFCY